jgi:hypothetical protein
VLGRTLVREDERGKKKAGVTVMQWGVGTGQGRCHTVARRGASVAVGRHGVADSSLATALTAGARAGGARSVLKQGRAGADLWAPLQSRAVAV